MRVGGIMNSERVAVFKVGADDSDCDEVMDDARDELFVTYSTSCWKGLVIHISEFIKWIFSETSDGGNSYSCMKWCIFHL